MTCACEGDIGTRVSEATVPGTRGEADVVVIGALDNTGCPLPGRFAVRTDTTGAKLSGELLTGTAEDGSG
jgi:hypothetical protein